MDRKKVNDIQLKGFPRDISLWIILAVCLVLGHLSNNNLILSAVLIVIVGCFILINIDKKINLLFFLIPWTYILRSEPGTRTIFSYLTVGLLFAISYKSKLSFNLKKISYITMLIILVLFQKLIIGRTISFDEISLILPLTTLSLIKGKWYNLFKWDEASLAFIFGLFLSIIAGLILYKAPHMVDYFRLNYAVKGQGVGLRFSGVHMDPNGFGAQAIFGCSLGIILTNQTQIRFKKWFNKVLNIMVLFIFIAGFFSGSKAYFFVSIVMLILYIVLLSYKKGVYSGGKFIFIIGLIIIVGYVLGWWKPLITRYTARFMNADNLDALSSGRNVILKMYFKMFTIYPWVIIFGTSLDVVGLHSAAHNTLVQSVTRLGSIGFLIIILLLKETYKIINNNTIDNRDRDSAWIRLMPLLMYLLMSLSLDLLFKLEFLYIVFLGVFIAAWFKPLK